MDCPNFIFEVVNEFLSEPKYNGYIWARDCLNVKIDHYVNHNNIKTNKKIVVEIGGGVAKALKLYEYHFGSEAAVNMQEVELYKHLAHMTLLHKMYSPIMNLIIGILKKLWSSDINIIQRNLNIHFIKKKLNENEDVYIKDSFKIYEDIKEFCEDFI
jgi:hypothetical protein